MHVFFQNQLPKALKNHLLSDVPLPLRDRPNGRLLGDRSAALAHNRSTPGLPLPAHGHPRLLRHVHLLHERHDDDVHR